MTDTALGLTVAGGALLLVLLVGLLDLRRRGLRHQVSDAAVRRGLAAQDADPGLIAPRGARDLPPV